MPKKNNRGKNNKKAAASSSNVAADAAAASSSSGASIEDGQRTASGVLVSHPLSRDIKIEDFSLSCYGRELITSSTLEFNWGRRYGLIGANGSGKSTFLKCLAGRDVPIPNHHDLFLLDHGVDPTDKTALQTVIEEAKKQQKRLEEEAEELSCQPEIDQQVLEDIYERLDELEPSTFESRASQILVGLGFTPETMKKKTKDMSGGWRMRVALARALFVRPAFLLLDEPTNHLDVQACVWLENYLSQYSSLLLIVSHSQDFLNGVCTNTIHLSQKHLNYYTGSYDIFIKTKSELEANQMKAYKKQQEEIKHIKEFIASCGTYANLVRQAKSRQKILDKMEADGLIQPVYEEPMLSFSFPPSTPIPPPLLSFDNVSFSYSGSKAENELLYKGVEFALDQDSRVAIVGPNGVGKSTLLKLITGDLTPVSGRVNRNGHLRIGRYHQHSVDQLELDLCPIDYMRKKFSHMELEVDGWRRALGRFGVTGSNQTNPMQKMSDGLRARVCFAEMANCFPNLLLLDEPTNPLDMLAIDSLANALNEYDGGVVLVSHDFRLISQVAKEIWIAENKTLRKFEGSIQEYKNVVRKELGLE